MARAETQPTGGHSWRYELTTGHGVVAQCRAFTQQALLAWYGSAGAPGRKAADDAVLLVSEVVTNVCRHGGLPPELKLTATERAPWVQVGGNTRQAPRPHGRHHAARASGQGLHLVQRLAARSGCVLRRHGGKTVWFEVDIVPEAEAPDRS